MEYLKLTLSAVLQHYSSLSSVSKSAYYRTERYPTINAVVGLIGAALGIARNDPRIQQLKSRLDYKCRAVNKDYSIEVDNQNARAKRGYEFRGLNGEVSDKPILKEIEYLQDACFEVYIGGDEILLEKIHKAFLNPVYNPYMGKRSCIPNMPIVPLDFNLINGKVLPDDVHNCR